MTELTNILYFNSLNTIGGVESWLNYIANLYKDYDINVVYRTASEQQLMRLRRNVRCIKWNGEEHFKCRRLFVNYNPDILNYTEADEVIYMVHSDYQANFPVSYVKGITANKKITKYLAVSKTVQQSFYNVSGIMPEVCYNPIKLDKPLPIIRLCSAQRMTKEKGGERIEKLIKELDKYCEKHGTIYQYDIFTNGTITTDSLNVVLRQPILDVNRIFGSYDFFIALSSNEAFCYSVVESLMRGTPCVVTPCPVFEEIGLNENNSIQLEFNCSNVTEVVEKIFTKKFDFEYEPPKSNFLDYISKEKKTYKCDLVLVTATNSFFDLSNNTSRKIGDSWIVDTQRANYLEGLNLVMKGEVINASDC